MPAEENPLERAEALIAQGRAGEAASALETLIESGRGGLLARIALVRALIAGGHVEAAIASARETALLNPSAAVAALSMGEAMLAAGKLPVAIGEFQRALRFDPNMPAAREALGRAWLEAGEPEMALEAFSQIDEADVPGLARNIAQAESMRAQSRSEARYVRHLFDQFSTDYDSRMRGQLAYRAPEILRELTSLVLPQQSDLAILDLGCGTGLSGEAFRDMAAQLDGIDLSPAMIEKARALDIYTELRIGDIETALASFERIYDLVLAADTIVYLGDLSKLLSSVAAHLADGGMFLFTVEKKNGEGFELGPKRRWRHSEAYLREAAAHAGFEISGFVECSPRMEAGVPVDGVAVALTR